ncbi:Hypothetical protein CINCED_3A018536 [Cinara cedri]|uniref:Uncharacterized protein n=1 Tax=Cinara cedri TaxID=506608 RepID=A0A5E4MCW9_9HEMI|nr:Hypothetical protein CINCED_3A018536 [Cinara cedri]
MAANSFYLDEVQEYLDYIRTIGMEAWIPDSPGYGPKIPVPDQCRFGVLCLNYKGSDIYIRSNSHRAMNLAVVPGSTYSSENRRRSVRQNPVGIAVVDYGYESRNRFFVVDREENYGITERVPSKRSVGVQCGDGLIRYNGNHFYYSLMSHRDDCNGSTRTCTAGYDGNSVITDSVSDNTYVLEKMVIGHKLAISNRRSAVLSNFLNLNCVNACES